MRGPLRRVLSVLAVGFLLGAGLVSVLAVPAAGFGEKAFDSNKVSGAAPLLVYSGEGVAQSFTASQTYLLKNVSLRLKNDGSLSDTLNVTIRPDAGGVPSTSILAWATPLAGGTVGPVNASLTPSRILTAGSVYWIVATKTGTATDAYEWSNSGSDTYAGGQAMINTTGSWTVPGTPTDMWFVTYGLPLPSNVTIAMTAAPSQVLPKESVNLTVYLNNTGAQAAPTVWVNVTLPSGLAYASDTSASLSPTTGYPNYTFTNLANGNYSFRIGTRVTTNVPPRSVLTTVGTLAFTNATGSLGPRRSASVAVTVGLQWKQLYLLPTGSGGAQNLTPSPPTNGTQVSFLLARSASATAFQLVPPLARTFRATNVSVVLYLDSKSYHTKILVMNFTLLDVQGASQTPVAYTQMSVTTNNMQDFQQFLFSFPRLDANFSAGHRISLLVKTMSSSQDDALLAMNATATPSRMDILTPTYVRVDALQLRDAMGVATQWSPKDLLNVTANVSDPFGSAEIAGAWINLTDPLGSAVLTLAPMILRATDTSPVPAWKLLSRSYGPPLANGTYGIEVAVEERNGVLAYATASINVSAPRMSLSLVPSVASVLSGDTFAYAVWYNNTGTGRAAHVWLNVTFPSQVVFLGSSADVNRTGNGRWTFSNVSVGTHLLTLYVQVQSGTPPAPSMTATSSLNVSDAKGYLWPRLLASAGVVLQGPVLSLSVQPSTSLVHSNETFVLEGTMNNTGDLAGTVWLNLTLPGTIGYSTSSASAHGGVATITSSGVSLRFTNMSGGMSWTVNVTLVSGPGLARGTNLTITETLAYTNARGATMPLHSAATTVRVIAPNIVNASVQFGQSVATPGDVIPAYLNFTNNGDEASPSLVITLSLDPSLAYKNGSRPAVVSGTSVLLTLSNIGLTTVRIHLNFTVSPTAADGATLAVSGFLVFTDRLGNPLAPVSLSAPSVTVRAPVLAVAATPGSPTVEAGMTFVLHISLRNTGSGIAGDAWLNVTLPAAFVYVSDNADGERAVAGSSVSWHWSGLLPSSRTFDLGLSAVPSTRNGTAANLSFGVRYTDVNGDFRPDAAFLVTATVIAPTILATVTVDPSRVPTATQFDYTLTIQNVGMSRAKLLWVSDSLDPNLQMIRYASDVPASGSQTLNWTYTNVQPQETKVISLFVQIRTGVPVGANISNGISVTFTNSNGTVVGFVQSLPVSVYVVAPSSPLPYVFATIGIAAACLLYVVYRKRRSRIEEVFLVTREGLLIDHMSRNLVADKDPDIVGGMLTGIQQFVKDAFKVGEDRALHEIEFGNYHVLIERGDYLYLAVVTSGGDGFGTGRKLRRVIEQIERFYGAVLKQWDGDMDKILGPKELIRSELLT